MNRLFLVPAAALALFCGCSLLPLAGGSSQQGNGVVIGRVVDASGAPVADVRVTLLPALYDPVKDIPVPDSLTALTDAAGRFSIIAPAPVVCNIEAVQPQTGLNAVIAGMLVSTADTVTAFSVTVRRPGFVQAFLPGEPDTAAGYVYLPGTTRWAGVSNRRAVVSGVPAGFIPAVYFAKRNDTSAPRVIQTNLAVVTGDTTNVADYHSWNYSRSLYLNTTAGGANVAGTVTDFPVLVRLNSGNFVFGQAAPGGADVRFAKPDGAPLPFEIERWDAAAQQAEVWVKVDTVYGNDSAHYFMMYWGASTGPAQAFASSSEDVFDTSNGFMGVWHLAGPGNSMAFDATANHYDGKPFHMSAASAAAGMIGGCQAFDGDSSSFLMAGTANSKLNFPVDADYTICAWAYADTLDDSRHMIASKGDDQYNLELVLREWELSVFRDQVGWDVCREPAVSKNWTLVAGVHTAGRQYLYINGACVDSTDTLVPGAGLSRYTSFDFMIGKTKVYWNNSQDTLFFKGKIDEVRALNVAPSKEWFRLCAMNQKTPDALVMFRK